MKLVKLSLIAALAAGSLSVANAVPLEEAIKDVNFFGELRYRYDTGRWSTQNLDADTAGGILGTQNHRYRVRTGFDAKLDQNFRAVGELEYANDNNYGVAQNGLGQNGATPIAEADKSINLRQAYLQFNHPETASTFSLGRQQLNTIWTADMVGVGAKYTNTNIDGLTIALLAVDSFEVDSNRADFAKYNSNYSGYTNTLYANNLYGGALIGNYVVGEVFNIKPQLWFAHLYNTATLWAVDLDMNTKITEELAWSGRVSYLGNTLESKFMDDVSVNNLVDDGSLINVRGSLSGFGLDGSIGGVMYGKEGKYTINTIEDVSSVMPVGKELFYSKGSWVALSYGKNTFGYITAGYTVAPIKTRIGVQFLYGGTATGSSTSPNDGGGTKSETVIEAKYQHNQKLSFETYYSYLNVKKDLTADNYMSAHKETVRLQATYRF